MNAALCLHVMTLRALLVHSMHHAMQDQGHVKPRGFSTAHSYIRICSQP